jgi:hypothetical protein
MPESFPTGSFSFEKQPRRNLVHRRSIADFCTILRCNAPSTVEARADPKLERPALCRAHEIARPAATRIGAAAAAMHFLRAAAVPLWYR